jgi:hypothetical protein
VSYLVRTSQLGRSRPRLRGLGVLPSANPRIRQFGRPSASILPPATPISTGTSVSPTSANPWQSSGGWQGQGQQGTGGRRRRANWQTQGQPAQNAPVNTTGAPSTILNYDAAGNPVYSVPPPGQAVTGYDQYGNPIYGGQASASTVSANPYQSYGVAPVAPSMAAAPGSVIGTDASGNPIYSSPPTGLVVVGTDAQGNPIYGAASAASTTAAASTDTSGYSDILNWLSESTLISGFPNWGVAAVIGGIFVWAMNRQGRR